MNEDSTFVRFPQPEAIDDPLTAVLRAGARRLLAQAIEAEAEAFLAAMAEQRLADGRARLVRHGHGPERFTTAISPTVSVPPSWPCAAVCSPPRRRPQWPRRPTTASATTS